MLIVSLGLIKRHVTLLMVTKSNGKIKILDAVYTNTNQFIYGIWYNMRWI